MSKILNHFFMALVAMLLLSGCIHRELIISGPNTGTTTPPVTEEVKSEVDVSGLSNESREHAAIPRVPFPTEEYAVLSKTGNGTIKGSIYIADAYGRKVYGKNTRLYLNPVTSYSKQWYTESYIGGYKMEKADTKLFNYLKFTASSSAGKFAFYGVADGSYYVIGIVKHGAKNIRIAQEVHVQGSTVVNVDLKRMID